MDRLHCRGRLVRVFSGLVLAALTTGAIAQGFGGPGAHFFLARGFNAQNQGAAMRCANAFGASTGPTELALQVRLDAFQPNASDGEIGPSLEYTPVGLLTLCPTQAGDTSESFAVVDLFEGADMLTLQAQGQCTGQPVPDSPGTLFQSCSVSVIADTARAIRGGLITNNGLVRSGQPTVRLNSHPWTIFFIRGD